jgi:aldehyde dehydrogenase (NAD+)
MTTIEYDHLYIGGQWTAPASAERIQVIAAATEEPLGSVPAGTEADIDAATDAARKAFDDPAGWAAWSPVRRGDVLERFARVLAPRSRYGAVVEAVTALARSLKIGDPLEPDTKIGPLVSARQRRRVESYIAKGKADGSRLTAGGGRPDGLDRGWFVEPTIFADVDPQATIAQEEIFGPVLAVIPYSDEHEAVAIANDSDYGLGGSVWTSDPARGASFARKVRSGTIGVNGYVNDPYAPFGGVKASGMGRELGPEGLQPFQLLKTIYLDEANDPSRLISR